MRKADSGDSSLYHPHQLSAGPLGEHDKQKHGIHNLGYSKSSDSSLRLEVDNNQVNHRLHGATSPVRDLHRHSSAPPAEGELYIIQPEALGPRWGLPEKVPSQVPVYPNTQQFHERRSFGEEGRRWDGSVTECANESLSADEIDEGVGGTPEYPCDTGDEGSVLSVDIHTSTTSLSSADDHRLHKTADVSTMESGISVAKSEDEEEEGEVHSITDSMVAEALAALEAATAGEDF